MMRYYICCAGEVHLRSSTQTACCGKTTFDNSLQGCCGIAVYNKTKEKCFDEKIQAILEHPYDGTDAMSLHLNPAYGICQICNRNISSFLGLIRAEDVSVCNKKGIQSCVFNEDWNAPFMGSGDDICCKEGHPMKFYHTRTEICCNGTVHKRLDRSCCNGVLFNPTEGVCCNNTLHNKEDSVCCGNKRYKAPAYPFVCCGGTIYNTTQAFGCCGDTEMFDSSSKICCEYGGKFKVAPWQNRGCCLEKDYDFTKEQCIDDRVIGLDQNICGTKTYNTSQKTCCDETLHDTPPYPSDCCGSQLYNKIDQKCCKGPRIPIPSNRECCGKGHINPDTHMCCNNVGHSKVQNTKCCGIDRINELVEGCCGAKKYNLSTQRCYKKEDIISKADHSYPDNEDKKDVLEEKSSPRFSLCRACVRNYRLFSKRIKSGKEDVCKKHTFKTVLRSVSRVGRFWTMQVRLTKNRKIINDVQLTIPCKCSQLNVTEGSEFLLLTDSEVALNTLRLGDSDLFLPFHYSLAKAVVEEQRKCWKSDFTFFVREIKRRARKFVNSFINKLVYA